MTPEEIQFDEKLNYANAIVREFKCKLSYAVTREVKHQCSLDGIDSDTAVKVLKIQMNNLLRLLEENGIKTK